MLSIFCVPVALCIWFLKNALPSIVMICIIAIYWENYIGRDLCTSGLTMFPERLSHRRKNMLHICWMNKYINEHIQYWVDFIFFQMIFTLISKIWTQLRILYNSCVSICKWQNPNLNKHVRIEIRLFLIPNKRLGLLPRISKTKDMKTCTRLLSFLLPFSLPTNYHFIFMGMIYILLYRLSSPIAKREANYKTDS